MRIFGYFIPPWFCHILSWMILVTSIKAFSHTLPESLIKMTSLRLIITEKDPENKVPNHYFDNPWQQINTYHIRLEIKYYPKKPKKNCCSSSGTKVIITLVSEDLQRIFLGIFGVEFDFQSNGPIHKLKHWAILLFMATVAISGSQKMDIY